MNPLCNSIVFVACDADVVIVFVELVFDSVDDLSDEFGYVSFRDLSCRGCRLFYGGEVVVHIRIHVLCEVDYGIFWGIRFYREALIPSVKAKGLSAVGHL